MLVRNKLPQDFYQDTNVTEIAIKLLGKQLFTHINGEITGGVIVETEAYNGITDKASHAYNGRFTERTKIMYKEGGVSYVYLCYGIHYLINVVTGPVKCPQAVLIRAIEPVTGLDVMLRRRDMISFKPNVCSGPGALSQALGITKRLNDKDLGGDEIWIEDAGFDTRDQKVVTARRIGVDYAEEDALLPWRFYFEGNKFVSRIPKK
ncbi:DNA-3-methyladenine glycosylase [Olivibacter domesticus]|uniref:Putative 3-methyladenine DNA glycosylase n=1 Tax=Olivibacter domesticus TaxID=407022 RepID=A0A1H7XLI1_OLID1|nr:DNA-3-methyladenine glycosylase [Olivibacter domesticus]SEM34611.1 DNA-3-methyladenine glycosylase [Olivibacter domesticus]